MPRRGTCQYDITALRQLWSDGKTCKEIAAALGCSEVYVSHLRREHKLPLRKRRRAPPVDYEPTPAQIADEARKIRERNLAAMLAGDSSHAAHTPGIRQYALGRYGFAVVS